VRPTLTTVNRTSISVVIPTHNRLESLARAVESVLEQSRPIDEIIIVDNGSEPPVDPERFRRLHGSVLVVRNDVAVGAAAARNMGVAHATGDFVAFLDDDDTWTPNKLEFVEDCLASHPDTDVVIHRTGYHVPAGPPSRVCSPVEDPLERMIRSQPPHVDGVTIRRSLHGNGPFDETMAGAEDLDYLISLAKFGASMTEGTAVLAVLGIGHSSAISNEERIAGRMSLLDRHPEILADHHARSFFHVRLGHLHRRGGQRVPAVRSFTRAIVARPMSLLGWKGLVRTLVGR